MGWSPSAVVADLAGKLIDPVASLLSEFITDKDELNRITAELSTLASRQVHELLMGQIEINKIEASSEKWWKAGWRPFVGWMCGMAMAFNYMVVPILGIWVTDIPVLDITTMFPVLMGMLGLGGLRTVEKHAMIKP